MILSPKASVVRDLMLRQHARVRLLAGDFEAAAARLLARTAGPDELHEVLVELRASVREHNAAEEALLEPLLREMDAVGPQRAARMFQAHEAEHDTIEAALDGDDHAVARRAPDIVEMLDAHMQAEERVFLNTAVLRDEA
jgi:hypothetical protein